MNGFWLALAAAALVIIFECFKGLLVARYKSTLGLGYIVSTLAFGMMVVAVLIFWLDRK